MCNTLLSHSRSLNIIILHAPTFSITNYMNRQIQSRYNGTKDILNFEGEYMLYWCNAMQYLLYKIEGICNLRSCFFALSFTFKCAQLRQCKQWGVCRKERCSRRLLYFCMCYTMQKQVVILHGRANNNKIVRVAWLLFFKSIGYLAMTLYLTLYNIL